MPSGEVHYKHYKRWLIPVAIGSAALTYIDPILGPTVFGGYALGRWIDPDLDLISISSGEGRSMRELKIFGVLIVMWFFPYAWLMRFVGIGRKGHRNFFSHFPGVSTIIRLAWLLAPVITALWYFNKLHWVLNLQFYSGFSCVLLGLTIADFIHFMLDITER